MTGKKGKQKKAPEPNEASKLIAARISQLESDAAGEKDQEAEIGQLPSLSHILSRSFVIELHTAILLKRGIYWTGYLGAVASSSPWVRLRKKVERCF